MYRERDVCINIHIYVYTHVGFMCCFIDCVSMLMILSLF